MNYLSKNIFEIHKALVNKEVTPLDLVKEALEKIKKDTNNAFEYIYEKEAIKLATELSKQEVEVDNPLWGIPFAIKDNFSTKDIPTTGSSKLLEGYLPPFDAEVYARLLNKKAIPIAKTTLDELAMGGTGSSGHLGKTYNPWDDETDETRHSDDVNVIYFDFHGNTTYNPTTSKRTQFKTELFNYHIEFLEQNIVVVNEYADLRIRLTKESTTDYKIYPMGYTTVTVIGTDGRIYDATTDANGEVAIRVDISEDTLFTTSYNGSSDGASVSIFKQTPIIDFTTSKSELFVNDALMLRAIVKDESNNPINGMDVTFEMDDGIIGTSTTDNDGVAILSLNDLTIGTHDFIASVGDTFLYDSVESDVETVIAKKHSPSISLSVKDSLLLERTDTAFEAMLPAALLLPRAMPVLSEPLTVFLDMPPVLLEP